MEKYFIGCFDEEKAIEFRDVEVGDFFIDVDEELMMKIEEIPGSGYNAISISRNDSGFVNFYPLSDNYECCVVSIDIEITEVI